MLDDQPKFRLASSKHVATDDVIPRQRSERWLYEFWEKRALHAVELGRDLQRVTIGNVLALR
jgi:hypothetical protein